MRIFKNELFKVFDKPMFLIFMILLFLGNILLLGTLNSISYYSRNAYKQAYSDIKQLPDEEQIMFIEKNYEEFSLVNDSYKDELQSVYTEEAVSEYFLFQDLYNEARQIRNYPDYLSNIMQQVDSSEDIFIFNTKDAFSRRNITKTSQAFQPLINNELHFTNSKMLSTAMDFNITDVFFLFLLIVITTILIVNEKENRQFILLRPTKNGRLFLMASKIGVLFFLCVIITVVFYTSNFIVAGLQYGFADFSVKIQSVYGFEGCALNLTIWQYLIVFNVSKIAMAFLVGLILFSFAITARSAIMVYMKTIVLFLVSFLFNLLIPGQSAFHFLKYVNLIYFARTSPIYQYYFNLNIFNFPINMSAIFVIAIVVFVIALIALNLYWFAVKGDNLAAGSTKLLFQCKRKPKVHTSLLYHEMYKILITNKVLLILLFLIIFEFYLYSDQNSDVSQEEYFYQQYMQALEGSVNDEKMEFIENEQQRFYEMRQLLEEAIQKNADNQISSFELSQTERFVQEQLKAQDGFEVVLDQLSHIKEYNQRTSSDKAWFVYKTGWNKLTGTDDVADRDDIILALILSLTMILSFSSVFSNEYSSGMICLINSCRNGRLKIVKTKMHICIVIMTFSYIIINVVHILSIQKQYNLFTPNAYICSIPSLENFPINLHIWQYVFFMYLVRHLSALAALFLILFISVHRKHATQTILVSFVLFIIPLILSILGIGIMDHLSLNLFLSGNRYLIIMQGHKALAFLIIIPISIGLLSARGIRKTYKN